jgi:hypothetical protein
MMHCSKAENRAWDKGFFSAITVSLKDLRLWFIVIPSLILLGLSLVLLKPTWLGGVFSCGLALVASYLISTVEKLPRPNEKELAENLFRKVLLPAATGILIIPSFGLFADLWTMQWHWFHADGSIPACSSLWTIGILGWLGILIVPVVIAFLTRERAVFATMVGLMVYVPMNLTTTFSGDNVQRVISLLAKSCQVDTDDIANGFGAGMVAGVLSQALMAIFVAKVVSTWLSRKNAPTT